MVVAQIGTGSFGFTMAVVLAHAAQARRDNTELRMFVRRKDLYEQLCNSRIHGGYELLSDVFLPNNVKLTRSNKDLLDGATHIVLAVPSKYMHDAINEIKPFVPGSAYILSLTKGLHFDKRSGQLLRMSELISNELNHDIHLVASLGGPNTYKEICQNFNVQNGKHEPCNAVVSSCGEETRNEFQTLYFLKDVLRVYNSQSIISSEICGALKNVLAFGVGLADGYGLGINFKASLITRGTYEIARIVEEFGDKPISVFGISGLGDIIATSLAGRSRQAGELMAKYNNVDRIREEMAPNELEALQTMEQFVEWTVCTGGDISQYPIIEAIYKITKQIWGIPEAIKNVINRPQKAEFNFKN